MYIPEHSFRIKYLEAVSFFAQCIASIKMQSAHIATIYRLQIAS